MQYSEQRHKNHDYLSVKCYRQVHDQNSKLLWDIFANSMTRDMACKPVQYFAGTVTAYIDEPNRRADMGMLIIPEFAGQGYGLAAWKLAMGHVYTRVPRIFAGMMAHNRGMRRVCEKSGMCESGRIPDYFQFNGQPEDAVFYRRDR